MKISCNVIRDILPLYAEDLASEDTKKLVDEHLCGCDECTRELGILKKVQVIPVDADTAGLKKVKKTIVIRRIVAVMTALLMVLSIYTCFGMLMDAQIYLDAEDIVESVEALEDGTIRIHWKYVITGVGSVGEEKVPEGENTRNFGIICYTVWAMFCSRKKKLPMKHFLLKLRNMCPKVSGEQVPGIWRVMLLTGIFGMLMPKMEQGRLCCGMRDILTLSIPSMTM